MRDEAHVGLVDAHAEGDRRHHDQSRLAQEAPLVRGARRRIHAGVVRQRRHVVRDQELRDLVDRVARQRVDDARFTAVLVLDERQQLRARVALLDHAIADVRPIEAGDEDPRFDQQALGDLLPRRHIGSGGQRDARHGAEALAQHRELAVLGPEVMAPLRHAVRFVDGEQRQPRAALQVVEQAQAAIGQQSLGRDVQQVDVAGAQAPLDRRRLGAAQRRVEEGRTDADFIERRHLVLHQRDERRDDDTDAGARQRRNLVAQGLAAPRGHEHQRIEAVEHGRDHLLLEAAEAVVAEDLAENLRWTAQNHCWSVAIAGGVPPRDE